ALDEEYLGVDMQLGGLDQRHIFAYAREWLPKLGYKKRVEIMTPLVLSLKGPGTKMSASIPASHIKIYDSEEQIAAKLSAAYCPAGEIANNPVLQICRHIIFPIVGRLTIERQERFGGRAEFESYAELEQAFVEKKLHPADLKKGVADALTKLFSKARKWFEQNKQVLEELGQTFLP
ncbi:MAG: tyrosine--tRNA ligase, partial [Candidatus Woesearchaeota archaeon]